MNFKSFTNLATAKKPVTQPVAFNPFTAASAVTKPVATAPAVAPTNLAHVAAAVKSLSNTGGAPASAPTLTSSPVTKSSGLTATPTPVPAAAPPAATPSAPALLGSTPADYAPSKTPLFGVAFPGTQSPFQMSQNQDALPDGLKNFARDAANTVYEQGHPDTVAHPLNPFVQMSADLDMAAYNHDVAQRSALMGMNQVGAGLGASQEIADAPVLSDYTKNLPVAKTAAEREAYIKATGSAGSDTANMAVDPVTGNKLALDGQTAPKNRADDPTSRTISGGDINSAYYQDPSISKADKIATVSKGLPQPVAQSASTAPLPIALSGASATPQTTAPAATPSGAPSMLSGLTSKLKNIKGAMLGVNNSKIDGNTGTSPGQSIPAGGVVGGTGAGTGQSGVGVGVGTASTDGSGGIASTLPPNLQALMNNNAISPLDKTGWSQIAQNQTQNYQSAIQGIDRDTARQQGRANEVNAMTGGSAGGGYAAALGSQVALGGIDARLKAGQSARDASTAAVQGQMNMQYNQQRDQINSALALMQLHMQGAGQDQQAGMMDAYNELQLRLKELDLTQNSQNVQAQTDATNYMVANTPQPDNWGTSIKKGWNDLWGH